MKSWIIIFFLILGVTACSAPPHPKLRAMMPDDVILAFGDSLTYGTGATPETSYPAYLEQIIKHKVINAGVPGEETKDSIARIEPLLDEYNPRIVIICLGGNDLIRKRDHAVIKKNLQDLIKIIKSHFAQVVVIGVPAPALNLKIPDFYSELEGEMNVPVDVTILPELERTQKYKSDYIHLNQQGYEVMAQDIADFLKQLGALR